jgi:ABC-type lipoprotein export system ATPase subunit/GNAT superfamily N-acetyltransferase
MSGADRVIIRETNIERTPRVLQLEGMFDIAPTQKSAVQWAANLPCDERPWNIGLIVGPSGSGKSTVAREVFGDAYCEPFVWSKTRSIIDSFPSDMSIKDISLLLSSVGFSSPPSWLRPFPVLSNGEQFRVTLARALAERAQLCVFDEFTSVVDRTVGQIGSAAVAKTVRRRKQQFVAVTCHDDVIAWLDPDWIYTPVNNVFQWRSLRRRPDIVLAIGRVHHTIWPLFAHHHYLSRSLAKSAICFAAFLEGRPVAFDAWLPFVGQVRNMRRVHRSICLPDYQGVGIGSGLTRHIASMWRGLGYRASIATGHPAIVAGYNASPVWKLTSAPKRHGRDGNIKSYKFTKNALLINRATNRLTASFEYVGPALSRVDAEKQLDTWADHSGHDNADVTPSPAVARPIPDKTQKKGRAEARP